MSTVEQKWREFLTLVLDGTFSKSLSNEEIKERVEWILLKIKTIKPDDAKKFYKSILYCMNNSSISKMAIGFKLDFTTPNYQDTFNNAVTPEIDNNEFLSEKDKLVLDEIILNECFVINHHMDNVILNNSDVKEIERAVKEVSEFLKIPHYDHIRMSHVKDGDLYHYMTFSQLLYCVVFNQNPYTGLPCSKELIDSINEHYHHRCLMMSSLKSKFPTGIDLKYVRDMAIFG